MLFAVTLADPGTMMVVMFLCAVIIVKRFSGTIKGDGIVGQAAKKGAIGVIKRLMK